MEFRPCIDIHNGHVKQIIGSSLQDSGDYSQDNFVSSKDAAYYADLYRSEGLKGGHVILLNPSSSPEYEATRKQALGALAAYPGGLMIGGGIHDGNALEYIDAGASHVIVTSYVFREGRIDYDRIRRLYSIVGKEHLCLDLSCRKSKEGYLIATDRWQKLTDEAVTPELLDRLSEYCDEFLVHAVDVEGQCNGIEVELAGMLGLYEGNPITYAGGVSTYADIDLLRKVGNNRLHVTIGSALDLFGGSLSYKSVIDRCSGRECADLN